MLRSRKQNHRGHSTASCGNDASIVSKSRLINVVDFVAVKHFRATGQRWAAACKTFNRSL